MKETSCFAVSLPWLALLLLVLCFIPFSSLFGLLDGSLISLELAFLSALSHFPGCGVCFSLHTHIASLWSSSLLSCLFRHLVFSDLILFECWRTHCAAGFLLFYVSAILLGGSAVFVFFCLSCLLYWHPRAVFTVLRLAQPFSERKATLRRFASLRSLKGANAVLRLVRRLGHLKCTGGAANEQSIDSYRTSRTGTPHS